MLVFSAGPPPAVTDSRGRRHRRAALLADAATVIVVAVASIAVALWVTPMQTVEVAGQTVRVGVAAPSLSLSGPGEVDLFGQQLPTTVEFAGPVRPRLELTRISLSRQLSELVGGGGPAAHTTAAHAVQNALVHGWFRYLAWQVGVTGVVALLLLGAIAGWRRRSPAASVALVAIGFMVAEAVNLGAIMVTAYTAPQRLRQVDSLQELVGAAPVSAPAAPGGPAPAVAGRLVVIGDSTAAGMGNPPPAHPDAEARACRRSVDSYAHALDLATPWQVRNLACSGATIRAGLLGAQHAGPVTVPAQLPAALAARPAAVIVSVGANDVNWSAQLRMCAASPDCSDAAQQAYFQQQLAGFTRDYLVLLSRLRAVPNPPTVVVNQYYDPFDGGLGCVSSLGLTPGKRQTLEGRLDALNAVLAEGARTAGFLVARPNFTGHGVCSRQPYVKGADAPAPLHPTAAGGLAIALADQQALRDAGLR